MSVNKVILVGRLGKDPELRYTTSGTAACSFTLATTEKWKDKSGERQEKTEWHNIAAYERLAEICNEYLKKGSQIYIEGKLTTEKWQTKEGQDRYTTKVVIRDMQILDKKVSSDEPSTAPATHAAPKAAPANAFADLASDIPF